MTVTTISPKDVSSITDLDMAFGTTRHLPAMESIPSEFKSGRNIYIETVEAIFAGTAMPNGEMTIVEGVDPHGLNRFIRAHLSSWEPKHEHKIAGVAYLLSQLCTIVPPPTEQPQPPRA